jgi:cell division septation protein DedD
LITQELPIIELHPSGIEIIEEPHNIEPIERFNQPKQTIRLWKYAAAVFLIPMAFYSYWIPMKTNVLESGVFAIQDFNPFHKSTQGLYDTVQFPTSISTKAPEKLNIQSEIEKINSNVTNWSYPFDEQLFVPVQIQQADTNPSEIATVSKPVIPEKELQADPKKVVEPPHKTIKIPATSTKETATNEKKYYLIANCFGSENNAQNFVNFLKSNGLDAKIMDVKNGLHRVSAGQSSSIETIQEVQNKLKSISIDGAWILKQ